MISDKKIGILGGGQLGKMLCEASIPWHLSLSILDKDRHMPAAPYCSRFVEGNFKDYQDVYDFGRSLDILTIEIEHVNLDALFILQQQGIKVYPRPEALVHIVDKGLQKEFYLQHHIPTASFKLFESRLEILEALYEKRVSFPFIQKARTEGYDGRGVAAIHSDADLDLLMDVPSVIEAMVDIKKEISVITARNPSGQVMSYDPVEMLFREGANLLDVLICPADIDEVQRNEFIRLAEKIIREMDIVGLLAVEFFLDHSGRILVNEIAPRPHNSGHHTIETNLVSQYEQHLRALLDLPLGKPCTIRPAVMINLVGDSDAHGEPRIEHLQKVLEMEGVHFHWYGKKTVKPFRKMGHITVQAETIDAALEKARQVKNLIKIKAKIS